MYINHVRWEIKSLCDGIFLSNICSKNYWNQTVTVQIIVGGWLVYFFGTQCTTATTASI